MFSMKSWLELWFSSASPRRRCLDVLVAAYAMSGLGIVGRIAYWRTASVQLERQAYDEPLLFTSETVVESAAHVTKWLIVAVFVLSPVYSYYVVRFMRNRPKLRRWCLVAHLGISTVGILPLAVYNATAGRHLIPELIGLGIVALVYAQCATWLYFYLNRRRKLAKRNV
jgi:hypothetical protein